MEHQRIARRADLRKYRTELPNCYDDAGLDPYEFRLLAHYVRVGNCFESTRTTAEKCRMSPAQVVDKRRSLGGKGLVHLSRNRHGTILVEIVDKWRENFDHYSQRSRREPRVPPVNDAFTVQTDCSPSERRVHVVESKNEPIRKGTGEERTDQEGSETCPPSPLPPALAVYKAERDLVPEASLWKTVAEVVGEDPADLEFWRRVVHACALCGYSPRNLDVALDYFERGEIPTTKRKSNRNGRSDPLPIPSEAFARRADFTDWEWRRMLPSNRISIIASERGVPIEEVEDDPAFCTTS